MPIRRLIQSRVGIPPGYPGYVWMPALRQQIEGLWGVSVWEAGKQTSSWFMSVLLKLESLFLNGFQGKQLRFLPGNSLEPTCSVWGTWWMTWIGVAQETLMQVHSDSISFQFQWMAAKNKAVFSCKFLDELDGNRCLQLGRLKCWALFCLAPSCVFVCFWGI